MNIHRTFIFAITLVFSITNISDISLASEFSVRPAIALEQEYNDNVFLEKENKDNDYITRIQPSIMLNYNAPRWRMNVDYGLDYRYFLQNTQADETSHNIRADAGIEALKEIFFIDISDSYSRVSLDIARDFTNESQFMNQSDRNEFGLNPYFILRPINKTTLTSGYAFTDVWFKEDTAIDRRSHAAYADMIFEPSSRMTLSTGYRFTKENSDAMDYKKNDVSAGLTYGYAEGSSLFVTIGNSWINYDRADNSNTRFWNAGVEHKFPDLTGSIQSSVSYIEDPTGDLTREDTHMLSLLKSTERFSLGIYTSIQELRDTVNKVLESRLYSARTDIRYEVTPGFACSLDLNAEKIEEKLQNTYTRRYLPTLILDYTYSEDLSFTFTYNYVDSHSPEIEGNNYKNNRFIVGLTKLF